MNTPGNPYRCAQDGLRYLLHVSGGRTSGMLLYRILDAYGGRLPANVRAVFANTGKEHAKTLTFLRDMERRWRVPITWVEYTAPTPAAIGDPKNTFRIVDYDTASRRGEPFAALIRSRKMLPNATPHVHRGPQGRDRRPLRADETALVATAPAILGIRHDEPKRWAKALWEEQDRVSPRRREGDAERRRALRLAAVRSGSAATSGTATYASSKASGSDPPAQYPERADWWIEQERYRRSWPARQEARLTRFLMRYTYEDLRAAPMMPFGELLDDAANDDPHASTKPRREPDDHPAAPPRPPRQRHRPMAARRRLQRSDARAIDARPDPTTASGTCTPGGTGRRC